MQRYCGATDHPWHNGAVGKKRRLAPELAEFLAASGKVNGRAEISPELAERLAAYGKPPKMPTYDGDPGRYAAAVNVFQRLDD